MSLYYLDDLTTIHHGGALDVLRAMPDESVHSIVTDPPYGLSNTDPRHVAETITRWVSGDREYVPSGRGFMGKEWDAFVPPVAVWDECLRVLKPGGHLLAFAGSRTADLMGLAIRLAGFDIRDSLAWLYGSGFPKSHDVGKAIDKLDASDERRARALEFTAFIRESGLTARRIDELTGTNMGGHFTTAASQPAVATADLFDLLRPHLPDVPSRIEELVAQRTVESQNFKAREVVGKSDNGIAGGTGRHAGHEKTYGFGAEFNLTKAATPEAEQWEGWGTALKPAFEPIVLARKPLAEKTVARNVLAHGTGAINVDACRIESGENLLRKATAGAGGSFLLDGFSTVDELRASADVGGKTPTGRDARATLARYEATQGKTFGSTSGRWPANVALDEDAAEVLDRQSGVSRSTVRRHAPKAGTASYGDYGVAAYDQGVADEGGASRFFYTAKAPKRERPNVDGVQHPTVKPLALMRWLVRMVTPPDGVVLDPFVGSGTTVEAAILEEIRSVGIELSAEYLPLIEARIERSTPTYTLEDLL